MRVREHRRPASRVNELTALRVAADLGLLPRRLRGPREGPAAAAPKGVDGGENELGDASPALSDVLADRPNEWQTSMEWRMTHAPARACSCGAGYSFVNRHSDDRRRARAHPPAARPRGAEAGRASGTSPTRSPTRTAGSPRCCRRRPGARAPRPLVGRPERAASSSRQGREAIGLALADRSRAQARLRGQGARPGGALTTTVGPHRRAGRPASRPDFADNYAGVDNAFKTLLLDDGPQVRAVAR
jgi:hypothetical protein